MRKRKTPNLVTIAILTTITVVFWIFFSTYRVFTDKPSLDVPAEILEPVSPTLDTGLIDKIESRIFFKEGEVATQIQIASPTAMPAETPAATPTVTPIPTATATASPSP